MRLPRWVRRPRHRVRPWGCGANIWRRRWASTPRRRDWAGVWTTARSGALQRAYRVVVGRDSAAVAAGCGDVWDSGRTDSDGMLVRYAGPKLDPFTRYYWAVTVWDKDYARSSSGVAAFETGMMGAGNWQGCWISDHHDINHKPAPYFRKEFSVGKRVKSARAYVAAAGLYELHINGGRSATTASTRCIRASTAGTSTSPTT